MPIKQIKIKNFQSHKNITLKLHPQVNVIIGKTDCGKSAIFRAIRWCIANKPLGNAFCSNWGGKTDVELTFEDGLEISRVKDNKINAYYLLDPKNKKDEEYKAWGKGDLPEDITTALNLESINVNSQFDPPFMLSNSPGDVASFLNKIANLTDIDTSISNIKKECNTNSREISNTEANIADLTEQAETFTYLDQMEKSVTHYEELCKQDLRCDSNHFTLGGLISRIEKAQTELNATEAFLKAEAPCKAA
jgi:exonuclease SbcC